MIGQRRYVIQCPCCGEFVEITPEMVADIRADAAEETPTQDEGTER